MKTAPFPIPTRTTMNQSAADETFARAERAYAAADYAAACPLYDKLLQAGISPGLMLYRLGMIANNVGKFETAYECHLKAVQVEPNLARFITSPEDRHHGVTCRARYDDEDVPLCPLCGSGAQSVIMVVNTLPISSYHPAFHPVRRWVQCGECGHGRANPRPTIAAMQEASLDPAPAHLTAFDYNQMTVKSDIVHDLWTRRPGGDFLDIGTANGTTASVALDYGYNVLALDIHSEYADLVRGMGVEFVQADITNCDLEGRRFDVITMGDVIEHIVDVKQTMLAVKNLLKPNGLLWLSTPNVEGAWTRAMKANDAMWMEGEHIHFFSLRSLKRLMHDIGLNVVDYRLSKRYVGCAEIIAEPS